MKAGFVNLASLAAIQASNAALPLLVFPYVLSVTGSGPYSDIVVSEAIMFMALAIVLYSFDVDGVARVVGFRLETDTSRISEVFSRILVIRGCLLLLVSLAITLISLFWFQEIMRLTLFWMLVPLGMVLQSHWLFQGLERNAPLAVVLVLGRVLTVCMIFIVVKEPQDFAMVPLTIGGLSVVSGLVVIAYAGLRMRIRFRTVAVKEAIPYVSAGKNLFLGNASVMLYRNINVIILGALGVAENALAAYSIAEKLIKSIQASIRPLNQFFLPKAIRLTRNYETPSREVASRLNHLVLPQIGALLALSIACGALYIFVVRAWPPVSNFSMRPEIEQMSILMLPAIFIGAANYMFGTAGLNSLGESRVYLQSIIIAGLISVVTCIGLSAMYGAMGAAIAYVLAEALLLSLVLRRYYFRVL